MKNTEYFHGVHVSPILPVVSSNSLSIHSANICWGLSVTFFVLSEANTLGKVFRTSWPASG